jgi:hypothetical protein
MKTTTIALFAALAACACALPSSAQVNTWTNNGNGKWEAATNWSAGAPSLGESLFITNANTKTVTVDATTSGVFSNTLVVSNLTISSPSNLSTNKLTLSNAGTAKPLVVQHIAGVYSGGAVQVGNSALQIDGLLDLGSLGAGAPPATILLTSGSNFIGNIVIAGYSNSSAALTLTGGTTTIGGGALFVADGLFSTGTVAVAGGHLNLTGSGIYLGVYGRGTFSMTGGSVTAPSVQLGSGAGSVGTLTMNGGSLSSAQYLVIGNQYTSPCSVTVSTNSSLYVTNGSQTAYIDVEVNSSLTINGGQALVDNLVLTNGGAFNLLSGTFSYTKPFQVENGASVNVSGGTVQTLSNFVAGSTLASTGTVVVANGGILLVTNGVFGLGNNGATNTGAGIGTATVSNATLSATFGIVGSTAGGLGTLTLQSNAVANFSSNLTIVSGSLGSTNSVTVASGASLLATNGSVQVGPSGSAEMDVSGLVSAGQVLVGGTPPFAKGFLHLMGGHVQSPLISANQIVVDGGDLDGTGGSIFVGLAHDASVTVNSGTGEANNLYVGFGSGTTGTFVQNGGKLTVSTAFTVGDCDFAAVGNCTLNSGSVCYVTNASHTATLVVKNGTFVLNPGATLVVDNLDLTSSCGQFRKYPGSTLTINGSESLNPNVDSDGDGESNAAETAAGTDPLDPTSTFHMVSAAVSGPDILVTWTSASGHHYVVQRATTLNQQTPVFSDLSPVVPSAQTQGSGTTSWRDAGAAAGSAEYYRVRLSP